jgi:hypothetical protein
MAKGFNLTAQINLRGPGNLKPIVAEIKREIGSIQSNVQVKLDNRSERSISVVTNRLRAMNDILISAKGNADSLNASFAALSSSLSSMNKGNKSISIDKGAVTTTSQVAKNIQVASTAIEEFGKQSALAVKRFAAFSFVTTGIFALTNAITSGFKAFVSFDKELVKLQQVTGQGSIGIKSLENEITRLATSLGVSSESLISVASTLAQAGLSAKETRIALAALAKTELAPSFDSLAETTEGAIAALRQFQLQAEDLEPVLGSINAVAAAFAVESADIITAIQRTGGVFAAASKGVTQGKDALNEFIAVFTSVRATTRESAETIATGLRTIFTRIQRSSTINLLKNFGINLQDLEGKFVGPYEAVKRLSEGLSQLDPRDVRFSAIVEELGGFRQIGKVIPLIQQFATAQQALAIAQKGSGSLTDAQIKAQQSLANQLAKVREQFLALIRDIGQSTVFQSLFKIVIGLTSSFLSLASAFKPILPILAVFTAIKGVSAIGQFASGFFGGIRKGGGAKEVGSNIGSTLSGAKEKEANDVRAKATTAITENTNALKTLTTAVNSLTSAINIKGPSKLKDGGKILGFNKGGMVPGNGGGDTVPAFLEGGEIVMNRKAVKKYGANNLLRMNSYASGGIIDINDNIVQSNIIPKKQTYTFDKKEGVNFKSGFMKFSSGDKFNFQRENKDIDVSQYPNKKDPVYRKYQKTVAENKPMDRGLAFENIVNKQFNADFESSSSSDQFSRLDGLYHGNLAEIRSTSSRLSDSILSRKVVSGSLLSQSPAEKKASEYLKSSILTNNNDKVNFGKVYVFQDVTNLDNISKKEGQKQRQLGIEQLYSGEIIQKFMAGSPGGINVPSGKGRGKKVKKGARGKFEHLTSSQLESLSTDELIDYANRQMYHIMTTGGSGISLGKEFVEVPESRITSELEQDLVTLPDGRRGFYREKIAAFGSEKVAKSKKSEQQQRREKFFRTSRDLLTASMQGIMAPGSALPKAKQDAISPFLKMVTGDYALGLSGTPRLKSEEAPVASASSTLLASIKDPLSEFRKSGGQTSLAGVIPPAAAEKIKAAIPAYIESLKKENETQKAGKAQTALKYFDDFINGGTAAKPAHATHFAETINQILKGGLVQGFAGGGSLTPQQLVGGPFPKGRTSSQGETWSQILTKRARELDLAIDSGSLVIGGRTISLSKALTPTQLRAGTIVGKAVGNNETTIKTLASLRENIIKEYLSGRQEVDEADPFNLTEEEKRLARSIAVVGIASDYKAASRQVYKKVGGVPFSVSIGSLSGAKSEEVLAKLRTKDFANLQEAASELLPDRLLVNLTDQDLNRLGRSNAEGYQLEAILALLGAAGGEYNERNRAVDFEGGLPPDLAALFGVPSGVFTQAKRTLNSDNVGHAIEGIAARLSGVRMAAGGPLSSFASGGTIPAMVSNGEAFIPPSQAKKIGYSKLNKINQADRNGMNGFAVGGGIFKGPGSGTSDSIGPIDLPVGGYVIRKKAVDALNSKYNSGGIISAIRGFKVGGQAKKDIVRGQGKVLESVQEAEAVLENVLGDMSENIANIIRSKFKGIKDIKAGETLSAPDVRSNKAFEKTTRGQAIQNVKASAIGLQITGEKGGATTETVAHETGHLADVALGGGEAFASEMEGTFQFALVDKIRKDMEDEWKAAGKSSSDIAGYLSTGKELFAEFFAKASPEVRAIITSTTDSKKGMALLADHLHELGTHTVGGLEASDIDPFIDVKKSMAPQQKAASVTRKSVAANVASISATSGDPDLQNNIKKMSQVIKEITSTLIGLKAETSRLSAEILKETNSIKQLQAQNSAGQKVSGELREAHKRQKELVQQQESIILQSLQTEESLNQAQKDKTNLIKQARTQKSVASEYVQSTLQTGEKSLFKSGGGGGGGPPDEFDFTNSKAAQQSYADEEFFKYKAQQTGTSESAIKLDLAQKLGKKTYENQTFFKGKVSEAQTGLVARRESAMKIGQTITEAQKQLESAPKGSAEAAAAATRLADAQSRLAAESEAVLQQMIELRPDLAATKDGMDKLAAGAKEVAQELSTGNLQSAQEALNKAVQGTGKNGGLSRTEAQAAARAQVSKETGTDIGLLERQFGERGVNARMAKTQEFVQSREGQRFGAFAQFAPGLTKSFAGTRVGKALGTGADFISGKGGAGSQLFAKMGGFGGIGSAVAVGAEGLKQLLPKSVTSDPNTAGALGALGGAGAGAAMGAQLGSFAGPIGTLIGGIGGALIGGINGWFSAKNQAIFTNALENMAKSTGNLDEAFKKLDADASDVNFQNAQKAFGSVLDASKDIESIAFSKVGFENIGSTLSSGTDQLSSGIKEGDIGKILMGGLQTGFGLSPGGMLMDYLSTPSEAQRTEAMGVMVSGAGQRQESAVKLAETQMKGKSTEELGKIFDSLKNGTGELNPIVDQYVQGALKAAEAANGTKQLTAAQEKAITAQAKERAALDAYMKKRKESGATDEQITKEISSNRSAAIKEGQEAVRVQGELFAKQQLLARSTKEIALATESLLDVYRRVGARAQKFGDEISDMMDKTQSTIDSLGGKASVQKVDRSGSERILGNMAAYSSDQVKMATDEMVGKLGGTEEAKNLGQQAQAAKFLQDKLPAMLRAPGADAGDIIKSLRDQMGTMGIGGDAVNQMLKDLEIQMGKEREGGLGTLADEIAQGGIDKLSSTAAEAAKTLQNLSKTYNDALQQSIDLQNQYNQVIMQSNEYMRKAGSIRINAELDLAKALGNSPTLQQLNEPFDFEVRNLTQGLVPGGTTDPTAIANGIVAATAQNQQLQAANVTLGNVGMAGGGPDAGAQLLAEQQKNIAAIGANNVAINEGRQALEKLANDGTKAANALSKIQEQQRQIEGIGNRFEKIFTSGPEELFKMNRQSAALELAKTAGAEQFKSRTFRQDAFAGLEQDKEFLSTEEYRKQRGMLMRKSLEAQGLTGQSMIQKGGISMTVDDFIKRIEGGVSEEDPNVKAYREAVATQVKANEELAMLNELQALHIQEAMIGLQTFLATEFPRILTEAVKDARTDAETKPETKPTSKAESAKAEAEKKKQDAEKQTAKLDQKIKDKETEVTKAKSKLGWEQGASTEVAIKERELKDLKRKRDTQKTIKQQAEAESAAADTMIQQEKQEKEKTKAEQKKQEDATRAQRVSTATAQSAQARHNPPATLDELNKRKEEIRKRLQQTSAQQKPQTTTSTTPSTTTAQLSPSEQRKAKAKQELEKIAKSEISRISKIRDDRKKQLAKNEKRLKYARIAAMGAGTLKGNKNVEEAQRQVDLDKKTLEKQNMLISEQEQILKPQQEGQISATVSGTKPEVQVSQTALSQLTPQQQEAMNRAGVIAQQHQKDMDELRRRKAAGETLTSQEQNALSVDNAVQPATESVSRYGSPVSSPPVPSSLPQTVQNDNQVRRQTAFTTTQPTEQTGQLLTLDPASLKGLNEFNAKFGEYVNQLVSFQFPTIPESIKMEGNHVVDVRVSGAAAFEALQQGIKDMINTVVSEKMASLWNTTGGALGVRPGSKPSSKGNK